MSLWLAIGLTGLLVAVWLLWRRGVFSRSARTWIERSLGGYRHQANAPEPGLPRQCRPGQPATRVAVIGGGLAGIGAAEAIAVRGLPVTLFERNPYLGGKVGAWKVRVGDQEQTVEHGFHAFFRQYYNLNRFLDRLGLRDRFRPIEDYLIIDSRNDLLSFGDTETTPLLNIVDLARRGFYRWRDVLPSRTRKPLEAFVRFRMNETYDSFDGVAFERFCDEAALPPGLRVSFRTFARAFFSDEADLSTADVLRAFHFYYLGHDHGLMYDFPSGDYETILLKPIREHLQQHGVQLRLSTPVEGVRLGDTRRFRVVEEEFDWVVIAADIPGLQSIVDGSDWLEERHPNLAADLKALQTSRGYAVWRIWIDRRVRDGLPTFINVERKRLLDSVTLYERITEEAQSWADGSGGSVLELHSYALPRDIQEESEVRSVFVEELHQYFPELRGFTISAEALQVRHDFPAFVPGQHAHRPATELPVEGMLVAGDWVRLPYPMTHMEAAYTSGLRCANVIFRTLGLQQEPIFTVAPKGLLPASPTRQRSKEQAA